MTVLRGKRVGSQPGSAAVVLPAGTTVTNSIIADQEDGFDCNAPGAIFIGTIDTDGSCGDSTTHSTVQIGFSPSFPGGSKPLLALLPGSVAADFGLDQYCPQTDIRGVSRPDGPCSTGSFELIVPPVVTVLGVTEGAIYLPGEVPPAGCNTTGESIETHAVLSVVGGPFAFLVTCSGATAKDGTVVPPVYVNYGVQYPLPTVTIQGVVDGGVYQYPNLPAPSCKTTDNGGGIGSPAVLHYGVGMVPGTYTVVCAGATNSLGVPVLPVSATYTYNVPLANVAITGVSDGATYVFASVPTPGCQTTSGGGGVSASATLSKSGTAPGAITVTCDGATNAVGEPTAPVSATYNVVCSRATSYQGLVNTKVNASSPGSRQVRADLTFDPTTCELTSIVVTPLNTALTGAVQLSTLTDWKAPIKAAQQNWKFTNNTIAAPTGGIYLGGAMRAMDKTSTLTVKLINDTNGLSLKLVGMAPTGSGSTKASFEIESGVSGLAPLPPN